MKSKDIFIVMGIVLMAVLVACNGTDGDGTAEPPSGDATATAPIPSTDGYPAQPTPTATSLPEDYPAPTPVPPPTEYPADMEVWLLRPLGEQCVDPESYEFADLDAAVGALEEEGVEVLASEVIQLSVCEACDCPTSEHFRVQIRAADLGVAQSLGWMQE